MHLNADSYCSEWSSEHPGVQSRQVVTLWRVAKETKIAGGKDRVGLSVQSMPREGRGVRAKSEGTVDTAQLARHAIRIPVR
jgi:hypothetical protein